MNYLFDDFICHRSGLEGKKIRHTSNSYAIIAGHKALLVDMVNQQQAALLKLIQNNRQKPVGIILTHRHILSHADGLAELAHDLRIPVFLHPLDAAHAQARACNLIFHNPVGHPLLEEFSVRALHFPGHTEGHIVLYWKKNGGTLLAGDSAHGSDRDEEKAGIDRLYRPPSLFNTDDNQLRLNWENFALPINSFCSFHGKTFIHYGEQLSHLMHQLSRQHSA